MNVAARPWRTIELCAGVGGLGLGIHIAEPASRCVAYVEREAFAAANLVARMEAGDLAEAAVWSDLTTFDAGAWRGAVDCVVSGDPCQPNSVAGKRGGADDDRFLIEHVVRVFDESGADRLFRENVTGNADGQLAAIVPLLEGLGCRVAVGIFRASGVGANHKRERLILMADREDVRHEWSGRARGRWAGPADGGQQLVDAPSLRRGEGRPEHELRGGRDAAADDGGALGDADRENAQGQRPDNRAGGRQEPVRPAGLSGRAGLLFAPGPANPQWADIIAADPFIAPAFGPVDAFAVARSNLGLPPVVGAIGRRGGMVWDLDASTAAQVVAEVRRMADGMANRVDRLRACGNGVVPLVAAYAWRTLDALLAADRAGSGAAAVRIAA